MLTIPRVCVRETFIDSCHPETELMTELLAFTMAWASFQLPIAVTFRAD